MLFDAPISFLSYRLQHIFLQKVILPVPAARMAGKVIPWMHIRIWYLKPPYLSPFSIIIQLLHQDEIDGSEALQAVIYRPFMIWLFQAVRHKSVCFLLFLKKISASIILKGLMLHPFALQHTPLEPIIVIVRKDVDFTPHLFYFPICFRHFIYEKPTAHFCSCVLTL